MSDLCDNRTLDKLPRRPAVAPARVVPRPKPAQVPPRRATRHGLSLVELLLVVAILSLLAGLILPTFQAGVHDYLDATARVVVGDLDYARNLAVTHSSRYRLDFDYAGNLYVLTHSGSNSLLDELPPNPFADPDEPDTQQTTDLAALPTSSGPAVKLWAVFRNGAPETSLEFAELGNTSTTTETVIWLAAGQGVERRFLTVHVHPVTGLATVGTYTDQGPPIASP